MPRCATCKRPLVGLSDADGPDDPRIACGGDRLWCVYADEQGAPPEYRATQPRGWPDDLQLADVVAAEVLAAGKLKEIEGRGPVGDEVSRLDRGGHRASRAAGVYEQAPAAEVG
ncbi:MAG: hypothetical protein ACLP01_27165 [Solirubrobacteraceae bacterium]